jgi:hypothetical protein
METRVGIKMKVMSGLLAVAALGAMTVVASAPAYASTTYRYVYVVDPNTGTYWYMSNCNNANGTCTLTTNTKYYGEYSFQSKKTYDGQAYYQMVDKATGECITLESIDTDLVESTCGIPSDNLTNQYWHYNGTSEESTNLYAVEIGQSSESCMLAWAADPADSTYTYTCGEGWNDQWHQPVA